IRSGGLSMVIRCMWGGPSGASRGRGLSAMIADLPGAAPPSWRTLPPGSPIRRLFVRPEDAMIYIGTDHGLFRWFHGAPWPVIHALHARGIRALAAVAPGQLAVVDDAGRYLETLDNGLSWSAVPLPAGGDRVIGLAPGPLPASVLLSTRGGLF